MNARKHRKWEQAKKTDRLGPKGKQFGSGLGRIPTRTPMLPVYRANLNHPVNVVEHGNAANPARLSRPGGPHRKAGQGRSLGMTEQANASGNALDKPTSVGSILARELVEPSRNRESK